MQVTGYCHLAGNLTLNFTELPQSENIPVIQTTPYPCESAHLPTMKIGSFNRQLLSSEYNNLAQQMSECERRDSTEFNFI
jgi:hypothetical protein